MPLLLFPGSSRASRSSLRLLWGRRRCWTGQRSPSSCSWSASGGRREPAVAPAEAMSSSAAAAAAAAAAQAAVAASAADEGQWTPRQKRYMQLALEQARAALHEREIPIGCVFVRGDDVIALGSNMTNQSRNATRHAELEAVDRILEDHGGSVEAVQFHRCELYVTIEPCVMCAGALSLLGIGSVFFGAANDKFGGCGSILPVHEHSCGSCGRASGASAGPHGRPFHARGGLFAAEAIQLLQDFYIAGNPAAPKPHRAVMEVPPWERHKQQGEGQQHGEQQQDEQEQDGQQQQQQQQQQLPAVVKQEQQQQQRDGQGQPPNGHKRHQPLCELPSQRAPQGVQVAYLN